LFSTTARSWPAPATRFVCRRLCRPGRGPPTPLRKSGVKGQQPTELVMPEPSPAAKAEGSAEPRLNAAIVPRTPFPQHCTTISDRGTMRGAIVDPGGDLDLIERAIAEVGMKPEKILLTHGHIDHAGGAAELRERLGVPIEGPHANERPLLDALKEQGR